MQPEKTVKLSMDKPEKTEKLSMDKTRENRQIVYG